MDDEDTLDEPEELLEQVRNAATKNQVPDEEPAGVDDETIPAKHDASAVAGLDDETLPADKGTFSPSAGLDDETIDVDPELIRRLREQRAEQQPADQPTDPEQTIARGSHDPQPDSTAAKRKRRRAIGIAAVAVVAAGAVALALLIAGEDNEPVVETHVDTNDGTGNDDGAGYDDGAGNDDGTVPSRPTLNVSGGDMAISANWSANDNGSPITSWEVDDGDLAGGPSATATSHTWSNVAPGDYTIEVRACNAAGCGAWTSKTANPFDVPSRPTLNVSVGDMTISANWSADENGSPVASWEVDDGDLAGGPAATESSYTWSNVASGDYPIKVRACNAAGCGAWTSKTANPFDVPSRPMLDVSPGDRTFSASWSANDNGSRITSWEVDDGNLAGGPAAAESSYTWSNVASGDYPIKVRACNAAGCGAWTSKTANPFDVPSQPTLNFSLGDMTISADWSANDNGSRITSWEVDDGDLAGGPAATETSHTWSNVPSGSGGYIIKVRACNAAGCGAWTQSGWFDVGVVCSRYPCV